MYVFNLNAFYIWKQFQSSIIMCWGFIVLLNLMAAVFESSAKSISIQNSTVKTSEILDQLYRETMLRFQIEKEVHDLSSKVADLEKSKKTHVKGRFI